MFFFLLVVTTFFACEKSITGSKVSLISPPNNENDSLLSKLFWWDPITGATKYQLQIVSPSFDSIVTLVLDSTMTVQKFSKTLSPGTYQWRVRGENGSTKTDWTTYRLVVKNTSSLTGQTITSMSPANPSATNKTTLSFSWDAMSKATSYLFKIRDSLDNSYPVNQSITTNVYNTTTTLSEGTYYWSVQALNSNSASAAAENKIIIDRTAPNTPSLTSPLTVSDIIKTSQQTFVWSNGSNTGTAISDSFFIAIDSIFKVSPLRIVTTKTSYTLSTSELSGLTAGKFYWKVRSKDAAGNVSGYSAVKSFTKQ